MKKIIALAVVCVLGLSACTDEQEATHVLTKTGYTDIHMTGYSFFGCSDDDFYHTGFKAKGPTGEEIDGTVCSGFFFKNSTVRFK